MRKSNVFGIHVEGASHVWRTLMVSQMSRRHWTSFISLNVAISFTSPVSLFASFLYYESLKIRMRCQVCLSCIDIHSIRNGNHGWRQNLIKPDVIYRMCIFSKSHPIYLSPTCITQFIQAISIWSSRLNFPWNRYDTRIYVRRRIPFLEKSYKRFPKHASGDMTFNRIQHFYRRDICDLGETGTFAEESQVMCVRAREAEEL